MHFLNPWRDKPNINSSDYLVGDKEWGWVQEMDEWEAEVGGFH